MKTKQNKTKITLLTTLTLIIAIKPPAGATNDSKHNNKLYRYIIGTRTHECNTSVVLIRVYSFSRTLKSQNHNRILQFNSNFAKHYVVWKLRSQIAHNSNVSILFCRTFIAKHNDHLFIQFFENEISICCSFFQNLGEFTKIRWSHRLWFLSLFSHS